MSPDPIPLSALRRPRRTAPPCARSPYALDHATLGAAFGCGRRDPAPPSFATGAGGAPGRAPASPPRSPPASGRGRSRPSGRRRAGSTGATSTSPRSRRPTGSRASTCPTGARLELRGRYPHARYMSLNAYSDGTPTDALSRRRDRARRPARPTRSCAGARRDARSAAGAVTVLDEPPPAEPARAQPNTIYARPPAGAAIELAYRVYEPDPGLASPAAPACRDPVADRSPTARVAAARRACAAVNDPNREITIQTVPAGGLGGCAQRARLRPADQPRARPDPLGALLQLRLRLARGDLRLHRGRPRGAPGDGAGASRAASTRTATAPTSTPTSAAAFGPVVVVEGRLPRFPRTYTEPPADARRRAALLVAVLGRVAGDRRAPPTASPTARCSSAAGATTRSSSRRAPTGPANARARCGVAWLDWGERGDGAGDPDYGLLIMRNMLVSPSFQQAIQRVARPGEEAAVMGSRFPRASLHDARGVRGARLRLTVGRSSGRFRIARCASRTVGRTGNATSTAPIGASAARRAGRVRAARPAGRWRRPSPGAAVRGRRREPGHEHGGDDRGGDRRGRRRHADRRGDLHGFVSAWS